VHDFRRSLATHRTEHALTLRSPPKLNTLVYECKDASFVALSTSFFWATQRDTYKIRCVGWLGLERRAICSIVPGRKHCLAVDRES
jgi:hypothetical protein